jgi:exodeoxyribonuclease V beta subunit
VVQEWRVSSFSQIAASHGGGEETRVGTDGGETAATDQERRIRLWDFPRGPEAGDLLHGVFETLDFKASPGGTRDAAGAVLETMGWDAGRWREPLARACLEVFSTPLSEAVPGLTLAAVNQGERLSEMEFLFPVQDLSRERLARAVRRHLPPPLGPAYADRLLDLSFDPLDGFVKGFVDLVFRFRGQWFLADYKSNHLGETYGHYHQGAMTQAMVDHHYILQYLLYVAALDRYLSLRMPGYDYDTHFGGVFYLFVRGMHPDFGSRYGIFHHRPDKTLIRGI